MKVTVFYSWQSDLPNNTNRGFIQSVIEKSIQSIKRNETFDLDICLERDTQGQPGSPDIASTILQKIDSCDIFVADISIVTRDLQEGKRFSPNPNVMIELGYAIKSIGWDRIILFCNEIYGTGDKLPFDIQQHRRIGYKLKPDDERGVVRDRLALTCRTAITEITESIYKRKKDKCPDIHADWTKFDYVISEGKRPPFERIDTVTDVLELTRANPVESIEIIEATITNEIEEVNRINGSIDPKWKQKVKAFNISCDEFLKQIKSQTGRMNYFIHTNTNYAVKATINLHNTGASPASDIRVEIELPDWILGFDHKPDDDKIPKKPEKPFPEIPNAIKNCVTFDAHRDWIANRSHIPSFSPLPQTRTSTCYIKEHRIIIRVDRLLHKHWLTIDEGSFYLLALPDSVPGEHALKANIFCVEYDDWEEADLFVRINANHE